MRRALVAAAAAALVALASVSPAVASGDAATVLVVVGAPGTPEYGARFATWVDRWKQASGKAGARFVALGTGPAPASAAGDRESVQAAISREARGGPGELWLVLVGHGTFDGRTPRFNLRGPDFTADELAAWLAPAKRPVVVIDATAASGPFLKPLSSADRVIVTATRSGREQNVTRLGGYLAEAIADPAADLDKDGQTSLLEAFLTASRRVESSFTEAGLLATEHALLDDNGDGLGTPATLYQGLRPARPAASAGAETVPDGLRAHQLHLVPSAPERAMPLAQRRRRDQIERQVLELRSARARVGDAEYYRRLEPLLVELARLYQR